MNAPQLRPTGRCAHCRAIVPVRPAEARDAVTVDLICTRCGGPAVDVRLRRLAG